MAEYGDEDFKDVYKPGRFRFKSRRALSRFRDYMRGTPLKGVRTEYPAPVPEPISKRRRLNEEYLGPQQRPLEKMLGMIVSIEALVFSIYLFSGNITGMATGNLTRSDANISGAALFIIGVAGILLSLLSWRRK